MKKKREVSESEKGRSGNQQIVNNRKREKRKKWEKRQIIALIIISLAIILSIIYLWYYRDYLTAENLVKLSSYGSWTILILLILKILSVIIFFIPAAPLLLAMSAIYGFYYGFLFILVSTLISQIILFFLTKHYGRPLALKFTDSKNLEKYEKKLKKYGFLLVLITRLTFFIPPDVVTIAAGILRMRTLPFILATLLGFIPMFIYYAYAGSNIGQGIIKLWIIIASTIAIIIFALIILLRVKKKFK